MSPIIVKAVSNRFHQRVGRVNRHRFYKYLCDFLCSVIAICEFSHQLNKCSNAPVEERGTSILACLEGFQEKLSACIWFGMVCPICMKMIEVVDCSH